MDKQIEAGVYIQQNGITAIFEDMMAGLLATKPDNPVSYLIQHLKNVEEITSSNTDGPKTKKTKGSQPPLIFMLGGPGSGKGSQCACIVRDFGYTHYSAGDLLRQEIAKGSERGKEIQKRMKDGCLVPSEWTVELLKNAVQCAPNAKGYLIDGFPRCLDQGLMFEEIVKPCDVVLVLECSEEIMMKRIQDRASTSGRVDDNVATLKKRFASNTIDTLPVIKYYESLGKVVTVNSERSIDDVHADISQILKNI